MNKKWGFTPTDIPENIYGHKKRLLWMMAEIDKHAPKRPKSEIKILEIGCGTGVMLSIPLASLGYDVTGVDTDEKSIEYANSINPYKNARFLRTDAAGLERGFDVIVVAEVLEHLQAPESLLKISYDILKKQGLLLVSVPNGYGWFEFEQFLWDKLWLGEVLRLCRIMWAVETIKRRMKKWPEYPYPATLSSSPHIQRITLGKIKKMLGAAGFCILEAVGSSFFSGKFSNLIFTGFNLPMKINNAMGSFFKPIASGYYLCCRKT